MSWAEAAEDFTPDGSLRDVYVLGTDRGDWERVYRFLRERFPHSFELDNEKVPPPETAEELLRLRSTVAPLLRLDVSGMQVNCHFFCEEEIELDLNPREVTDEARFGAVIGLLENLGRLVGKRVILTYENAQDAVVLEYDPKGDRVRYCAPRWR